MKAWWTERAWPWLRKWGGWPLAPFIGLVLFVLHIKRDGERDERWDDDEDTTPGRRVKGLAERVQPRIEERAERDFSESARELEEAQTHRAESERIEREVMTEDDFDELMEHSRRWAEKQRAAKKGGPLLALLLALSAAPARAQDVDVEEVPHPTTGELGVCVAPWLWQTTLAKAMALDEARAAGASADSAVLRCLDGAGSLQVALEIERAARQEAEDRAIAEQQRRVRAERERDAWYRSPGFLLSAGALVSGIGALAIVSAVRPW